ncbi:MAG: hypothetical protein B7Y76_10740, partial [Sphingobacteriia bacterium 35-40-5]
MGKFIVTISLTLVLFVCANNVKAQDVVIISGKVTEQGSSKPIANATIHIKGSSNSTMSKIDGSFRLHVTDWSDSVEITCVGFETFTIALQKGHTTNLAAGMKSKSNELQEVVITTSKKPGKSFMQKVIEHKANNNPSRFRSYSYQRYTRSELDIDNIDFEKAKGSGLKSLMLQTYSCLDTTAKNDKELPVYFSERLANKYHSVSPNIDRENIIAKKNLGLKTDDLLSKLDKFYFNFNVYDDWVPIFDQTYVSPLNSNAFSYYNFFEGSTMTDDGDTLQLIRFAPQRSYEKAFSGNLWINTRTLAVTTVNMHLNKTANLNFVNDINYYEEYNLVYDSVADKTEYMPYKYSSEVKFESGLALLGLPVSETKNSMKFIIKNTTVADKIKLNTGESTAVIAKLITREQTTNWEKSEIFWQQNRS